MKIKINQIGFFARDVLERSKSAQVSGISSRGIYLQPQNDWTLFISQERYCGPLTLNLDEGSANLDQIKAGIPVDFLPGEIQFPDEKITISHKKSMVWEPPKVSPKGKLIPGNLERTLSLAHQIVPDNPYLPLLTNQPGDIPGVSVIGERILKLQKALQAGDPEKISEGAIKLLGLGPGLTPLGDDFLLGMLLTLNRWGHKLPVHTPEDQSGENLSAPATSTADLNRNILDNTQLKTTRISSALLACAAAGAADQRLLEVLDGFFVESGVSLNQIRNMLRWGNSSGITVLSGMISVLNR